MFILLYYYNAITIVSAPHSYIYIYTIHITVIIIIIKYTAKLFAALNINIIIHALRMYGVRGQGRILLIIILRQTDQGSSGGC